MKRLGDILGELFKGNEEWRLREFITDFFIARGFEVEEFSLRIYRDRIVIIANEVYTAQEMSFYISELMDAIKQNFSRFNREIKVIRRSK